MLWTAIAALQRTEQDSISIVYSGDIDASKEEIIAKVKVCIHSIPLLCSHIVQQVTASPGTV